MVEQKERVADWEFAIPYNVLEPTFSAFLGEGGLSFSLLSFFLFLIFSLE